jgi:Domain of unknown function (DUF4263)
MITFTKADNKILLQYTPERQENWIEEAVTKRPFVTLKKTFTLSKELLLKSENTEIEEVDEYPDFDEYMTTTFVFAVLQGDYYKVVKGVLTNKFDIYFYHDIVLIEDYFVADSNVSIFKVIEKICNGDVYIGGNNSSAIAFDDFRSLLRYYPKNYERKKYVEGRISVVLRNYLDNVKDAESIYHKYLDKKLSTKGSNLTKIFREYELAKNQTILDKVRMMLSNEQEYSEHQWQQEILQIILLLYPKYLYVFKEVPVIARLASGIKEKAIDFLLIDGNGNIDIIEIKKPFENAIMTIGLYRDNYIPLRELSGTVMQIEKYIYYLNRWSEEGERTLTNKYKNELPDGFQIKITNPGGIIIMGREVNLTPEQKRDFEVVKRKYKNIVDIITYDSLICRLEASIAQAKRL